MKKRKNKNKILSRLLSVVGFLLIFLGFGFICFKIYHNYSIKQLENNSIQEFFNIQEDSFDNTNNETENKQEIPSTPKSSYNYIAVLEIPKINLKRGLLSIDDKNNNINKNVAILKKSDMPDVENGLLVLASHSGSANISYFRHLNKLEISDQVYIYYKNIKYIYEVTSNERQDKTGNITISKKEDETNLILTTCDPVNKNKQVIITTKLIDKMPYWEED